MAVCDLEKCDCKDEGSWCLDCYEEHVVDAHALFECQECGTEYGECDRFNEIKLCDLCGEEWICIACHSGEILDDNDHLYCHDCNDDQDTYIQTGNDDNAHDLTTMKWRMFKKVFDLT